MKIKKISTKVSLIATSMVIASALLVTIASLVTYRNDTIKSKAENALNIASCIAVTIDPVQYKNVIESGEQNEYYNSVFKQFSTIKQETGALYVYMIDAQYDTSVRYFVEGYLPGEPVDTYLGVEDDTGSFADEMFESIRSGSLTRTDVYDSGDYGLAISGFAPVKDNNGNVLAVVGIDIGLSDVSNNVLYFAGRMAIILLLVIFILSWIPVIYVTRSVSRPLQALCSASDQMSKGIVDVHIPDIKTVDEVGQLAASFNHMLDTTKDKTQTLDAIANGDLSMDISLLSEGDIMGLEMQRMVHSLNKTFHQINGISAEIAENAGDVSNSSMNLAQGATEQTAAVAALGQSIAKVAEKTLESAHMAMDAAKLGDTIKHNAEKGTQQMEQMLDAVKQITDASASIGNVIKVIDDIAFQTNILALNAAVEAARAGQHGKGFAVVAEEVRNLAAKSAEAAKDTGSLIENSIQKADLGAKIATATSASLAEIVEGINESSKIVNVIAESSKTQTDSINDINVGISQVGEVVHLISKGAELSSNASASMNEEFTALNRFVSKYKLKD